MAADAGMSHSALARAAGLPPSFLARILAGTTRPSVETYARLATSLGADLHARLYPNTGPAIRDRHQTRMVEGFVELLDPRWRSFGEVAVRRPARGWIDLVLHEPRQRSLVATEVESTLNRVEQLIRWSTEKAASLPSWDGWSELGDPVEISRLLIVRRTRATRDVAAAAAGQLRRAFPAHPDDALAALTGPAPWPGPSLVWIRIETDRVHLCSGR